MKNFSFLISLLSVFIFSYLDLESRQYNVDHLIDLIEADDEEGVKQFFPSLITLQKLNILLSSQNSFEKN